MSAQQQWKIAASVILASKSSGRVLMMRRGAGAKFMPNALVFPGGVVTNSDEKMGEPCHVAAIREVFEETGLLVGTDGVQSSVKNTELSSLQDKVKDDASLFQKIFVPNSTKTLVPWSCWLTPATSSKRFLTHFYILPVEGEPEIRMCEKEMAECGWEDPGSCVDRAFRGDVTLPPPQVYELTKLHKLKSLSPVGDPDAVKCPQPIRWGDKSRITNVLPGDYLYLDDDPFNQQLRTMDPREAEVKKDKPTHRVEYVPKPGNSYSKVIIHHHLLSTSHEKAFPYFL